jgi:hypothetical protein
MEPLARVQEKAVKMVSGLKATSYLERCEELKLKHWRREEKTRIWLLSTK